MTDVLRDQGSVSIDDMTSDCWEGAHDDCWESGCACNCHPAWWPKAEDDENCEICHGTGTYYFAEENGVGELVETFTPCWRCGQEGED